MMYGARLGQASGFRRFFAQAMAKDLKVFVVPGLDISRALGLDIEAAGMQVVASPRHANVLLVVGDLPAAMCEAASIVYAQMLRPKVLFAVGITDKETLHPLPVADVAVGLGQPLLIQGVQQLAALIASNAFQEKVENYDAPALHIRIEYVCPMHPEVVQDQPGSCPKCGMFLVPRETQANATVQTHAKHDSVHTSVDSLINASNPEPEIKAKPEHMHHHEPAMEYFCPMHAEVVQDEPGSCPQCGMFLEPREKSTEPNTASEHMAHNEPVMEYFCPMHAEVVQDEPGSCPQCGMVLEPRAKSTEPNTASEHMAHQAPVMEYFCPMHPEVVQDTPGECPKCGGMKLQVREKATDIEKPTGHAHHHELAMEYFCPMHAGVVQDEPGSCPQCGMFLEQREKSTEPNTASEHTAHQVPVMEYFCPMHPEVVQDTPGECPKCGGMKLQAREKSPETKKATGHAHHHEPAMEYFCPMHAEVVQDEPGSCPQCGMFLEPREKSTEPNTASEHPAHQAPAMEYFCPMHAEVVQDEPGSCPQCGMVLEQREKSTEPNTASEHPAHQAPAMEYFCPMHLEVVQDQPGSCPQCGMVLEPREKPLEHAPGHSSMDRSDHSQVDHSQVDHSSMDDTDHSQMNHDESGFMSMIDVTKDLPRSSDELQMEWIDAAFGPFFPGLPSGLQLSFSLDGDTVAGIETHSITENTALLEHSPMHAGCFVKHFLSLDPLTPVASQLLICLAMENAAAVEISTDTAKARIGALERERIVSHLNWLVLFAQQTGLAWLARSAGLLQLKFLDADIEEVITLKAALKKLLKKIRNTFLLKSRTSGIAYVIASDKLCGVVARAAGVNNDVRSSDKMYTSLGFKSILRQEADTWARLQIRLDEMQQSLALIEAAGALSVAEMINLDEISGTGHAQIEAPRGKTTLQLSMDKGFVTSVTLTTPSSHHLSLLDSLTNQQELGDALIAVGSLDLSPWEIHQ